MEQYDFKQQIGHGGCAQVFLAVHKSSGRTFAVKKISRDDDRPTRTKEALQLEARILTDLKHPYIVGCHESFFDEEEAHIYIVQDFCDGGTLNQKLTNIKKQGNFLSEHQVMQWFCEVCLAVQHCHENKILHRDIKSDNIFLTKKGSLKLGDFGVAKQLVDTWEKASTMCGTPYFVSPEMCQDQPYSSKSDVWALGCLLCELCALEPPFDSQNLISLFYKIVKGTPREIPQQYSGDIRNLVARLLSKSPDDRPSVSEVLKLPFVCAHMSSLVEQRDAKSRLDGQLTTVVETAVDGTLFERCSNLGATSKLQLNEKSRPPGGTNTCFPDISESSHADTTTSMSGRQGQDVRVADEYEDDFESSSDEEVTKIEAAAGADYESDFESDSEEELPQLIQRAQDCSGQQYFAEEKSDDASRPFKSFLEQQCTAALGKSQLDKLKALSNESEETKRSTLRLMVGEDLMETCYFASELLASQ